MEKCQECSINYPNGYVNICKTSQGNKSVCGICALEISNKVLSFTRTKFQGEMAEALRQKAISWREKLEKDRKEKEQKDKK